MAVLIIVVLLAGVVGLGLRFLYGRPRRVPDDLRRADSAQAQGSYDPQAVTDAAFDASVGPIPDWSDESEVGWLTRPPVFAEPDTAPDVVSEAGEKAEGWYADGTKRHAERWYSVGTPTALVRDDGVESHDPP
jgi:hypothetical protein